MSNENEEIKVYKDRMRIFLIIYFFSEPYVDANDLSLTRVFYTEVKIQKIDFLLRNPDYLSYELLLLLKKKATDREVIGNIIQGIFLLQEPIVRRLEMEKFFFGAYEDIDDIIAFLVTVGFVKFKSTRNVSLNITNKEYYVTDLALKKMKEDLSQIPSIQWYIDRCELIKTYFGDFSGSQLKNLQYEIETYKNTSYREFIKDIQWQVKQLFWEEYGENL